MGYKKFRSMSLSGFMPQISLLSNSSSSLREVTFYENENYAGTEISDIKYRHSGYQYKNIFHLFDNEIDYALTH